MLSVALFVCKLDNNLQFSRNLFKNLVCLCVIEIVLHALYNVIETFKIYIFTLKWNFIVVTV